MVLLYNKDVNYNSKRLLYGLFFFLSFRELSLNFQKNNDKFQEKIINCNVLFERIVAIMVLLTLIHVPVQVHVEDIVLLAFFTKSTTLCKNLFGLTFKCLMLVLNVILLHIVTKAITEDHLDHHLAGIQLVPFPYKEKVVIMNNADVCNYR